VDRQGPNFTAHLGYWSAATASLLAFGSAFLLYFLDRRWTTLADYAANYRDLELMPMVFWLALAPLVVIAMGSLHSLAEGPKKALSRLSFGFSLPYATIIGLNYFLQLTYVRQRILRSDLAGLDPWVIANPDSILLPLNLLGYFFLGLSTLLAAPLFSGNRKESALRALMVVHGVMAVAALFAAVVAPSSTAEAQRMAVLLLIVWGIVFGTAMALLAAVFRYLSGILTPVLGIEAGKPGGPVPFGGAFDETLQR